MCSLLRRRRHYGYSATRRTASAGGRYNLEPPEVALREAVLNTLAHRNYYERGAQIMVEVYDNRVEITKSDSPPSKGIIIPIEYENLAINTRLNGSVTSRIKSLFQNGLEIGRGASGGLVEMFISIESLVECSK